MSKKILVITGSPRVGGNTDLLAEAMIAEMEKAGHEVMLFQAGRKKVLPCVACDTCWSKGTACTFPDAFAELGPMLEQAEALVLVTPLYWFTFPAQMKAAIDKFYAYVAETCPVKLQVAETAMIVCGGDENEAIFAGICESFKVMTDYLQWKNHGMLVIAGVNDKADIVNHPQKLEAARELGRKF